MRSGFYDFLNDFNDLVYSGYNTFQLDVVEQDGQYQVFAELPGISKENITLDFQDGILTIKAKKEAPNKDNKYLIHERRSNQVERKINFGDINVENITAKQDNGILVITLTTKKKEDTKKTIMIE